jgi:type II secretory pathway component PulJ
MKFFIKIKTLHSPEVDDKVTAIHSSSSFRMKMQTLKGRKKQQKKTNTNVDKRCLCLIITLEGKMRKISDFYYTWTKKKTELAMTC